ncbi:uncharacterized protein LOC124150713 [Haliotis rufescens]|uniref:uncharacterized protein LOC124150713 n=1 Tax=Haliotis rufescens TaxID=6454 RepID=UPI00201F4927|nr:uncharacterized protein LOC124150713 [Haliotis rufescens]
MRISFVFFRAFILPASHASITKLPKQSKTAHSVPLAATSSWTTQQLIMSDAMKLPMLPTLMERRNATISKEIIMQSLTCTVTNVMTCSVPTVRTCMTAEKESNHRVGQINEDENIPTNQWLKELNCRDYPDTMLHCHDCDNLLCSDCHKVHDIPTQNRNHKIPQAGNIPLKQWLKDPICRDHPDTKLQLYDHTCKQAICLVCVHWAHKDHKSEAYRGAMGLPEEQVQKQQLKLEDVTDRTGNVKNHQNELGNTQRKLEQKVIEVFRNAAVKFLHRQRQLMNGIKGSLQAPNEMVQEKQKTTLRELLNLQDERSSLLFTGVLQKQSDENIKRQLPEDDTRDTRILLSCHGQKALGELIDTFGGLASSLDLGDIPDSQPTLQGKYI